MTRMGTASAAWLTVDHAAAATAAIARPDRTITLAPTIRCRAGCGRQGIGSPLPHSGRRERAADWRHRDSLRDQPWFAVARSAEINWQPLPISRLSVEIEAHLA